MQGVQAKDDKGWGFEMREKRMEQVGRYCSFQDLMREGRDTLKEAFSAILFLCTVHIVQSLRVTVPAQAHG